MKKQNVRTISLIVCTFTYLLIGAAVFDALESEMEKRRWEVLQEIENMVKSKYNISPEDFKIMETMVLKAEPHKAGQQWKFTGAFYYATTVLTTIGYGHSTPCTIGGKLFTMFYAIVGIPLGLVMFQSIGERVNMLSSVIIRWVKESLNCRQTQASELDLICVVTTLSSMVIAGGAAAFSKFEGWSYFDSVYYCFITLTTIGFGDMVALQKDNALNSKPSYVMFALIFILFGLAIVAACLNLLVLRFVTMNTEDERRDEQQAIQALRGAVRLEGDVITADGAILRGVSKGTRLPADPREMLQGATPMLQYSADDVDYAPSVCSCPCNCFGQQKPPHYHDPLSPIPPPSKTGKSKQGQGAKHGLLTRMPRHIEKSKNLSQSGTLRLNSASGYLFMNAKNPEFNIEEEDFRELVRRRREQLMDRSKNMLNYDTFRSNIERPSKLTSPSDTDRRYLSSQLYESRRSSFFSFDGRSENEKCSHDPLMEESYKEDRPSYSKRKLMKNVDRNIKDKKKKNKQPQQSSYFYDETDFRLGDDNLLDSSKVFSKRKSEKGGKKNNNSKKNDDTSVCVYRGGRQQEYSWNARRNDFNRNGGGGDQLSNDGSFGYYLTNDDDNEFSFINDTLTFTQPPHRASV